ncbi:MAG: DNA replication/repair protein RecF [Vicinamibacteria bacterium]
MERLVIGNVRNLPRAELDLSPGLNVLVGDNAQGKTSVLEAVGLLARGRSFRSEDVRAMIRRGEPALRCAALVADAERRQRLEIEVSRSQRQLRLDGRAVPPREYHGRLEVGLYSTERLRVLRGPMRERRQFLDRNASALWPAYRQLARDYERIVRQRNAALLAGSRSLDAWDESLVARGGELRARRGAYARRLSLALAEGFRPRGEAYAVALDPDASDAAEASRGLARELAERRSHELRARRSLVGPHRDAVAITLDGEETASLSAGQARSLLLALTLAALDVYRAETGHSAVALLDDLDSELDEARSGELCQQALARGQALVTTAHPGWAARLGAARRFAVEAGRVRAA